MRLAMVNFLCCSTWSSSFFRSLLLLFVSSLPFVTSLNFTYNFTSPDAVQMDPGLKFQGIASSTPGGIQLTGISYVQNATGIGRVLSPNRLRLWDTASGELISFTTNFSFKITSYPNVSSGNGVAFFLGPVLEELRIPLYSFGGNLGLFSNSANQVVAVEFDTFQDLFDPTKYDHIGIDANSHISIAYVDLVDFNMSNGSNTAHATVKYDGGTMNLSILLSYASEDPSVDGRSWKVSRVVDLRKHLPEEVCVGFSATVSRNAESHTILSWDFNSTELPIAIRKYDKGMRLLLGILIGIGIILCILGSLWFVLRQRRNKQRRATAAARLQTMFDQQRGPRSFAYQDLANATNNFAEEGKLGAGGFGAVYRGVIPSRGNDLRVAIKKILRESKQGEKEYMLEVILFSQLRHRNLVQLIGYCHEADDFLLVYEYMPNRSLDKHLYGGHKLLGWAERHKIVLGLASAVLYLHEEWEQCVVHRDIKPSNVMLDPDFNAKLGDFGLARLVDHDCTAMTTNLAGTKGYIAPEYEKIGRARKESDVFSFGVVLLEISFGRKPINYAEAPERINLVEWVWGLNERGACLEAADRRLCGEFDERVMERLMVLGLWCAHPAFRLRPSIRRAIGILSFEAPLPDLPPLNVARQEGNDAAGSSSSDAQSLNSMSLSSSYFSGRT